MDVRRTADAAAVFEKVTKVYEQGIFPRRIVALAEVSFAVARGEVLGLIGPTAPARQR